ncbi:MAG: polysulfide reductase NrfD [Anaerolineae bacterium]
MVKKILYGLALLAVVAGAYGFYSRLFVGERDVAYGSYVTWGLWVAMYLFFAGVASGAFMVATLDYLFRVPLFRGTGKYALWGALVTLPAALVSIGMDLGHMERIWKVYLQPNLNSLLAQMVWGYTLFGLVILAALWLTRREAENPPLAVKVLMAAGLALAIFVSGGVGALLGVNASRTVWHVGLLPAQFPIFSLATGIALMLAVLGLFGPAGDPRRGRQLRVLGIALITLLLVKTYIVWADFSQSLYGGVPQNVDAINQVLFGPYWWAFWILQILVGTVIPVIVLAVPRLSQDGAWAGWMGVLTLVGFAAARAVIIFPALTVPELEGLTTAFTGPHLSFDYFPSLMEWSVTAGVVGLATLAFLLGIDRLPMFAKKTEVAQ